MDLILRWTLVLTCPPFVERLFRPYPSNMQVPTPPRRLVPRPQTNGTAADTSPAPKQWSNNMRTRRWMSTPRWVIRPSFTPTIHISQLSWIYRESNQLFISLGNSLGGVCCQSHVSSIGFCPLLLSLVQLWDYFERTGEVCWGKASCSQMDTEGSTEVDGLL
jgi:hypothetical protein